MKQYITLLLLCLLTIGAKAQNIETPKVLERMFDQLLEHNISVDHCIDKYGDMRDTYRVSTSLWYPPRDTIGVDPVVIDHWKRRATHNDSILSIINTTLDELAKIDAGKMVLHRKKVHGVDSLSCDMVIGKMEDQNIRRNAQYLMIDIHPAKTPDFLSGLYITYSKRIIKEIDESKRESLNSPEFMDYLKSYFAQKGIEGNKLSIRYGSDYNVREHFPDDIIGFGADLGNDSPTIANAIYYTVKTEEELRSICQELTGDVIPEYINMHPNLDFYDLYKNLPLSRELEHGAQLFCSADRNALKLNSRRSFNIEIESNYMDDEASEQEYYILISDWNGRYILPKNWFRMKSWSNGKAVYRKGMKPKK